MHYFQLCLIFLSLLGTATSNVSAQQSSDEIVIFAASSLTNAFTDISERFESEYDVQITLNFAGSSTLAAQLSQGAEADVFASANRAQMQRVIDDGLIDEAAVQTFAENELVIITPADNPANIQSARDLANKRLFLALAAPTVPVREYTDLWLDTVSVDFGDMFVSQVLRNLVSEEPNVRQVVARVVLGEVDAGIVYRSDVMPDVVDQVQVIELPTGTSPRANYPIATLSDAPNPDAAALFINYLLSDAGQEILQSWGFCSPDNPFEAEMTPEPETIPDAEATC